MSRRCAVVVLCEDADELVVNGVVLVAKALLIVGNVVDVVEEGRAFADACGLSAGVVSELSEVDGAAEFLAVTTVMGGDDAGPEIDLMVPGWRASRRVRTGGS